MLQENLKIWLEKHMAFILLLCVWMAQNPQSLLGFHDK